MSIATEIQRIKDNISNTYTALGEKGATMPEVLNSNNLAGTVATVTTGGGGGSSSGRDPLFDLVDEDIARIQKISYSGVLKGLDSDDPLISSTLEGWWYDNNVYIANVIDSDEFCLLGYVFDCELCPKTIYINLNMGSIYLCKIPKSATSEMVGSNLKVTFSDNEKYLIIGMSFGYRAFNGGYLYVVDDNGAKVDWSGYSICQTAKYINITCTDKQYSAEDSYLHCGTDIGLEKWTGMNYGDSQICLEDITINKLKYSSLQECFASDFTVWSRIASYMPIDKLDLVCKMCENTREELLTNPVVMGTNIATTTINDEGDFNKLKASKYFPFAIDISEFVGANLYLGTRSATSSSGATIYPRFLLLKNAKTNIRWKIPGYGLVSPIALKYLADNAKNGSYTLYLNTQTLGYIKAQYPEIITTLQGKGWTVST